MIDDQAGNMLKDNVMGVDQLVYLFSMFFVLVS